MLALPFHMGKTIPFLLNRGTEQISPIIIVIRKNYLRDHEAFEILDHGALPDACGNQVQIETARDPFTSLLIDRTMQAHPDGQTSEPLIANHVFFYFLVHGLSPRPVRLAILYHIRAVVK